MSSEAAAVVQNLPAPLPRRLHARPQPRARTVRVGLLGYGRIGQAVARVAVRERARLAAHGLRIACDAALVRDLDRPRQDAPAVALRTGAGGLVCGEVDLVVEALGGVEPARTLVAAALTAGVPVVTANKSLLAAHGDALRALAAARGTPFLFEASVLAGVPVLGMLARRPLASAARRVLGIVNGTTHYITTAMAAGRPFEAALAEAVANGYAEPDSEADISGRDAAEKLAVLLQLAGCRGVRGGTPTRVGIDALHAVDFACAQALGGTIKPIALAVLGDEAPGAWVGPAFVQHGHLLASIAGVTNALRITGPTGEDVTWIGPGAGPDVTAATILDDIVEACLWSDGAPRPFAASTGGGCRPNVASPADDEAFRTPPPGGWFIRAVGRSGAPAAARTIDEVLASQAPMIQRVVRGEAVAVVTGTTTWAQAQHAAGALAASGAQVLVCPAILD